MTAGDTERPIRRARVQLATTDGGAPRTVLTDVTGMYEFGSVPPGRYSISASMPGYVTLAYGQSRAGEAGKPLVVEEGHGPAAVNLTLPRGGAIAGVVMDEQGRPVINATVTALSIQFPRGIRQAFAAASARTNDIGEFRIFGLQPASYAVEASKQFQVPAGASLDSESGYVATFFPGTRSLSEAARVNVRAGQTSNGITIGLDPAGTGSISGAVDDPKGIPDITSIYLRRIGDIEDARFTARSYEPRTGRFVIGAVPSGSYEIKAYVPFPADRTPWGQHGAVMTMAMNGDNVSGLHLTLGPLPTATGRIVFDTVDPPQGVRVAAFPLDGDLHSLPLGNVNGDQTFTVRAFPGKALLRPTIPSGWGLRAVRLRGTDVTDSGIEFRAGVAAEGVEIELTSHPAVVSGSVTNARGEPVTEYAVLLFPQDRKRRVGDSLYFAIARPDQTGRFSVSGLPAAEYFAAALGYVDVATAQDPERLEALERDALPFTLGDAESKSLALKIIAP